MAFFLKLDAEIFRFINRGLASAGLDALMLLLSSPRFWGALALLALLVGVFFHGWRVLLYCLPVLLAVGISDEVAFQILKPTFARKRPCYEYTDVRLVQDGCGSEFGFPSNHAANAMAAAVVTGLTARRRRLGLVLMSIATAVGFSRIYLGVHFPGDVLAGFVLGGLVGALVYSTWQLSARSLSFRLGLRNRKKFST